MSQTRAANAADAGDLARLHASCFPEAPWGQAALARLLDLPTVHARIVHEPPAGNANRLPVGFILALLAGGEAEILTLCVEPARRRRGIARALLADLYAASRRAKAARVVLEVASDNPAASALYGAEGFAPVGRRAAYYRRPDGTADALILARNL